MNSRSYFGEMNSILGSVVPLAMFYHTRDKDFSRAFFPIFDKFIATSDQVI